MKTTRVILALFSVVVTATSTLAQTVDFLVVSKIHDYTQTNNSTTVDASNPWAFEAHVEGNGDLSAANALLTIPSGTGSTTMTFNAGGEQWRIQSSFANQGLLDAAYGSGAYSLTAYGQTVTPINVAGNLYPSAPLATNLSGGTIVGGVLTWDVSQALTITITGTADHMGINIDGNSYNANPEGFGVGFLTFTVPATTFVAGNVYNVELDFDNIVGGILGNFTGTGAMASVQYAGVYTAATSFTIQAVPEPSTYAAIFGAVALAGVMIRRRRLGGVR
jgi:hypothetical protein